MQKGIMYVHIPSSLCSASAISRMASKNACEFPSLCPNNCNKEIKSEDDLKEHLHVCLLKKKFHALSVVLLELVNTLNQQKL